MKIEADQKLDFRDVLIRPRPSGLSSRRDVDIKRTITFPHSTTKWTGFPLIASNMDTIGTFRMAKALAEHDALTALSKYHSPNDVAKFFQRKESEHAFYSTGIAQDELEQLRKLQSKVTISKICIEIANGYISDLPRFVAKVRECNPTAIIMAGSVCTPEMTEILLDSGADIVRVGIGSGSVCITRKLTGVGYPQLSAIIECSEAARQKGGFICSDGGCTVPGDVCKAFGAGADFVMLGGMLAGHSECDGTIKFAKRGGKNVPISMQFYGMASVVAQKKHLGGMAAYRAAEGKVVDVPFRGPVSVTIQEIIGGLKIHDDIR